MSTAPGPRFLTLTQVAEIMSSPVWTRLADLHVRGADMSATGDQGAVC